MVSSEYRIGLYVSIPIYMIVLASAAFWANERIQRLNKTNDAFSSHYLAGRSLGPILSTGTAFASLFSGYTVVGIPNEAFTQGFQAFRWLPTTACIVGAFVATGVRLRKVSTIRNHQTPVDFITDRFQSQFLRYTIVAIQVLGGVIYLSAQVNSVMSIINSMFGMDIDDPYPVVFIMIAFLLFEWMGGLTSVAMTDVIQGLIMLFSFVALPIVITKNFGGWERLDASTYPRPDFYQTPSHDDQWLFWQFSILLSGMFTLPHVIQRVYATRDMASLRRSWQVLLVSPWLTMFVGVFLGTVGVQILADAGVSNPTSPFTAILEQVMKLGGFAKFVGTASFVASLAGVMSTADSLMISISHLITSEVFYPLSPNATPREMLWPGRIVIMICTAMAILIGIFWQDGITNLANIQMAVTMQAAPAFLVGLFAPEALNIHPWFLASSALWSTLYVFLVYFLYIERNEDPLPLDAGITGLTVNIVLAVGLEMIYRFVAIPCFSWHGNPNGMEDESTPYPRRPDWDTPKLARFGKARLTPQLLRRIMKGIREPLSNHWALGLFFLSISLVTPLVAPNEPSLDEAGNWSSLPKVIRGVPWWFLKQCVLCTIPYLILAVVVYRIPSNVHPNVAKSFAPERNEGIDMDTVPMTRSEMGSRLCFDELNADYHRRLEALQSHMDKWDIPRVESMEIGPVTTLIDSPQEQNPTQALEQRRKLQALVDGNDKTLYGHDRDVEEGSTTHHTT